jgi:hypothetical protein
MSEWWIKLHRQFLDHWLCDEYRPLTKREAWENMLFWANYYDNKVLIKGQTIECKRGQILYSLETWSRKFNWSMGQVRQFFKLLENDNMIKVEGLKYTTRLTICNYDKYQIEQQTDNKLPTSCQQTANKLPTTSKEVKKVKKEKKTTIPIIPTIQEVREFFDINGYDPDFGETRWHYYNDNNWHDSHGSPVLSWKQKMRSVWFKDENKKHGLKVAM